MSRTRSALKEADKNAMTVAALAIAMNPEDVFHK
jgi:hypothetical protein